MGPLDVIWHLLNFLAPAVGVGLIASLLSKLVWRRELRGVAWLALAGRAMVAGGAVLVAGVLLSGRDGRVLTYVALVLVTALVLWWHGFRRSR